MTCSTLTIPSPTEGHKMFMPSASLQCLNVVLSPQEQGLDDVEKLVRRPKAKAEERLREVLEEFVAGCRLECP